MEEIYDIVKDKKLWVRKTIGNFIEKILKHCGYDFDHDVFKKVIYSEEEYKTPTEAKIKECYDAYIYLLSNDKNRISYGLWKKFYYLYQGKELEENLTKKLCTKYFHILHMSALEQAIEYHMNVYQELMEEKEEDRLILSLMIFNYILLRNKIPTIQIHQKEYKRYEEARQAFLEGEKEKMLDFVTEKIKQKSYMTKEYYKNLKPVNLQEIIRYSETKKEEFKAKYQVKGIWIHGSIAKQEEKIDSDIDLYIEMNLDLLDEEKTENIEKIKEAYNQEFQRIVDIHEIIEYVEAQEIKEERNIKRLL